MELASSGANDELTTLPLYPDVGQSNDIHRVYITKL
jgi:hypothetical protein